MSAESGTTRTGTGSGGATDGAVPSGAAADPGAGGRPGGATTTVEVVFREERDVAAWAERHARGEVPGRWPYGLDELAAVLGPAASVTAQNLPEPGRRAVAVSKVRGALTGRRRTPPRAGDDVGLAWDEVLARRMLVQRPHARMHAGAIWVTDAYARDPRSERVRATLDVLRAMDGVFVNSRAQVGPLTEALGPSGPPASFFTFGVDTDFFPAAPYPGRPLLVSVGGDRDRDPATLFAALAVVRAERPDVDVVVQSASDLAPPDGVTKVPHLSHLELRALYARASVVVVATRPNLHMSGLTVTLESMSTGRPVVLTRTPGVEDYVVDGDNALLSTVGEPDELAAHVLGLLASPDDARALGERARAVVEQRFTSGHMVRGLARVTGLTG